MDGRGRGEPMESPVVLVRMMGRDGSRRGLLGCDVSSGTACTQQTITLHLHSGEAVTTWNCSIEACVHAALEDTVSAGRPHPNASIPAIFPSHSFIGQVSTTIMLGLKSLLY